MRFFEILGMAFLVALSGALSPGPLLSYTVYKSIQAKKKAYLVGLYVCLGHAILEFILIIILLGGMGPFISNPIVIIIIGILGSSLLIYFGITILRDIFQNKIDYRFLNASETEIPDEKIDKSNEKEDLSKKFSKHPIIGGILISMSNPYWWFWWAVIAWNFMIQYSISLSNPTTFWGFFVGHELGDFIWYFSISVFLGFTNKFMTKKIYRVILVICGLFMVSYGIYLGVSTFIGINIS